MQTLSEFLEQYESDYTSDEGPVAEYVTSFGYGEADGDEILDAIVDAVKKESGDSTLDLLAASWADAFRAAHEPGALASALAKWLDTNHLVSYYTSYNYRAFSGSIFSVSFGEVEVEIPDDVDQGDDSIDLSMVTDQGPSPKTYAYLSLDATIANAVLDVDAFLECIALTANWHF